MNWLLPPWIALPWKFIKGIFKAIPWQVWAAILLACTYYWHGISRYEAGVDATNAEWQARFDRANADADRKAREAEQAHVAEIDRIAKNLIEERNRGFEERDKTISDLRAGTRRVRDRFKCPAGQPTAGSGTPAAGGHGGAQAGLSDNDAEFLVREASRADEVVRQLTACQAVIRSDRD